MEQTGEIIKILLFFVALFVAVFIGFGGANLIIYEFEKRVLNKMKKKIKNRFKKPKIIKDRQ